MVDVILSRREDFGVFETYISEYDRSMSLLEESCRNNLAFASIVKKFEVKHWTDTQDPLSDVGVVVSVFNSFLPIKPYQYIPINRSYVQAQC